MFSILKVKKVVLILRYFEYYDRVLFFWFYFVVSISVMLIIVFQIFLLIGYKFDNITIFQFYVIDLYVYLIY